jgi:hypothetical protein
MAKQRDKNASQRGGNEQEERLEQALQPEHREDLLGQMEENTNLTGSTTWETLGENRGGRAAQGEPESDAEHQREQRAESGKSSQNPPRTTTGPITAPKFGSAGSGGAELEPGPEKD